MYCIECAFGGEKRLATVGLLCLECANYAEAQQFGFYEAERARKHKAVCDCDDPNCTSGESG